MTVDMKYNEHKKHFPVCIQAWLSTIRLAEAKPVYVLGLAADPKKKV